MSMQSTWIIAGAILLAAGLIVGFPEYKEWQRSQAELKRAEAVRDFEELSHKAERLAELCQKHKGLTASTEFTQAAEFELWGFEHFVEEWPDNIASRENLPEVIQALRLAISQPSPEVIDQLHRRVAVMRTKFAWDSREIQSAFRAELREIDRQAEEKLAALKSDLLEKQVLQAEKAHIEKLATDAEVEARRIQQEHGLPPNLPSY